MNALPRRLLHLLLVDDSPQDRALLREKLCAGAHQEYRFSECGYGQEALLRLEENPLPDALLLDMHMPLMSGTELLKRLREAHGSIPLPVIMLTRAGEDGDDEAASAALELGAQDYIAKDAVPPESLSRTVYNAMERFRLSRSLREKEEEYRLATEAAQLGVWSYEPTGRRFTCSGRCAEIMGLAEEEPGFAQFLEKIHPADRAAAEMQFLAAFGRGSQELNLECRLADGESRPRWVSARGRIHRADGVPPALMGTLLDVTARKHAEHQRYEEMEMLDAIYRIGHAFATGSSAQAPMQQAIDIAVDLTRAEFGAFFYHAQGDSGESGLLYTVSGIPREAFASAPIPQKTPISAHAGGSAILRSDDITRDPRYGKSPLYYGMPRNAAVKSYLAVPVVTRGGEMLGGLCFWHADAGVFTERSERIARAVAGQAAIGLENLHLLQNNERQRRLYETILSSTPDFVYIFDLQHRFIYMNNALLTLYGRTREEAVNKTFMELGYEPWHAEMHCREIDTVVATRRPIRGEVPFTGAYGKRIYDYIFVPVFGADGRVEAVAGTTRDITEARAQAQAVRKSEERQRLALAASHDFGIWDWDVAEDHFTADERFGALFGLSPEQARQGVKLDTVIRAIHPEDQPRVQQHIGEVLKTGGRFVEEYRVIPQKGQLRWVSARGEVQMDAQGKPVRFPGVGIDITAEREMAIALKESEKRWRNLADAMPQLLWTASATDGRSEYLNSRWQEYTGHSVDELLGYAWLDWMHPEDRTRVLEAWQLAVIGRADYNLEFRLLRHDGTYRWFKTRGVPIRDESGRIVTWYGTCTDIQDNVESREQAEAANIAKTEFLANMSHEIRTPMNAVIGLAGILAASRPLTPRQQEFIRTLQLSADSLLSLINDLLDISKIEARTVELEKIPFSLSQLMQEIISIMSVRAREKQLAFNGTGACAPGRTYIGDPTRLRQVVMNLCSNAIKFTEAGSVVISVTCRPTDDPLLENVDICVEDTGIGIAAEKLDSIFHKFVQADTSINRKYGGTGLGLTISKTLVEIMGGHIRVVSEPGKGSRFTITLPMRLAEAPAEPFALRRDGEAGNGADTHRPRILLVEDYPPNILVATAFLEQFGYCCDVACNGLDALEKVKLGRYALILMDVQMHGLNGLEATRLIRAYEKQHGLRPLPIIGMTAHALSGDRERCLGVGMDEYIAKPFDPDELKDKVAALLQIAAISKAS